MKRLRFLSLVLPLVFVWGCGQKAEHKPPNIIFIFTDDHALQAIGAYGSRINQTPNIDRLASGGMIFANAFCTNSICAPSRAVIQTGKHSHLNGVLDNRLHFDSTQVTFPKLLQQGGYQTAMIGKWHLKSEPVGFDYWKVLPGQGHYYNPDFRTPQGVERIQGYVTDIVTDLSIEWLESGRDASKPFMLMSQHKAPHRAWLPGPQHLTMFDGVQIPEPETLFDDYSGRARGAALQEMEIGRHLTLGTDLKVRPDPENEESVRRWEDRFGRMTREQRETFHAAYQAENDAFLEAKPQGSELVRWKYQRYIKDYLRCIASVDDNIGRLLDYLDKSGLADDTVVIYSSDQGFYLGEHGWFDKRWMYEESHHMPLIARWPGVVAPGSTNTLLVQNLDFAETFLDMAGIAIPPDMQGRSLVPLLEGRTPTDWRDSVYYHYHEYPAVHMVQRHIGVRTDRYKLIYYYQRDEWELFDLEKDPHELKSVHDDQDYAATREELTRELKRLQDFYQDDTVPVWQ